MITNTLRTAVVAAFIALGVAYGAAEAKHRATEAKHRDTEAELRDAIRRATYRATELAEDVTTCEYAACDLCAATGARVRLPR